jgi:uncharacterized protein YegP (UPF0339 family)
MQWNFYEDSDGTWRWELWDTNWTLLDSASGFTTAGDAESDAARCGYQPPPHDWKLFP